MGTSSSLRMVFRVTVGNTSAKVGGSNRSKFLEGIQQAVVSSCAQGRVPAIGPRQWLVAGFHPRAASSMGWSAWGLRAGPLLGGCAVFADEQERK